MFHFVLLFLHGCTSSRGSPWTAFCNSRHSGGFEKLWWVVVGVISSYACSQDHPHARKQLGNRRGGLDWRMKSFDTDETNATDGGWMKVPRRFLSFDFERPTCCRVSWRCTTRRPERKFFRCCFIICFCTDPWVFGKDTLCCTTELSSNEALATESVHELYVSFVWRPRTLHGQSSRREWYHTSWAESNGSAILELLHDMNEHIYSMIWAQDMYQMYQCIWYRDWM